MNKIQIWITFTYLFENAMDFRHWLFWIDKCQIHHLKNWCCFYFTGWFLTRPLLCGSLPTTSPSWHARLTFELTFVTMRYSVLDHTMHGPRARIDIDEWLENCCCFSIKLSEPGEAAQVSNLLEAGSAFYTTSQSSQKDSCQCQNIHLKQTWIWRFYLRKYHGTK